MARSGKKAPRTRADRPGQQRMELWLVDEQAAQIVEYMRWVKTKAAIYQKVTESYALRELIARGYEAWRSQLAAEAEESK